MPGLSVHGGGHMCVSFFTVCVLVFVVCILRLCQRVVVRLINVCSLVVVESMRFVFWCVCGGVIAIVAMLWLVVCARVCFWLCGTLCRFIVTLKI